MTKNSIYASKLYITSSAIMKKRIHAAVNNPLNAELLVQLPDDLDEKYQTVDNLVEEYKKDTKDTKDNDKEVDRSTGEESVDDKINDKESEDRPRHASRPSAPTNNTTGDVPSEDGSSTKPEDIAKTDEAKPDKQESSEVEESTKITKFQKVEATSFPRACCPDMKQTCDTIKTMLNLNAASSGVERVFIKDNELSIVYNDDINLNNVMNEVIESLNASGYNYLAFNRLARSKNSIVFEINFVDTANVVKPVSTILTDSE